MPVQAGSLDALSRTPHLEQREHAEHAREPRRRYERDLPLRGERAEASRLVVFATVGFAAGVTAAAGGGVDAAAVGSSTKSPPLRARRRRAQVAVAGQEEEGRRERSGDATRVVARREARNVRFERLHVARAQRCRSCVVVRLTCAARVVTATRVVTAVVAARDDGAFRGVVASGGSGGVGASLEEKEQLVRRHRCLPRRRRRRWV